jgi:hypothetical protein
MVVEAMGEWLRSHMGREAGSTMAQNRKKARAARAAGAGAGAMAVAGTAAANESPGMGWREWPSEPTSPAERGFPSWSEYEPEPSYWDRVTSPETYREALLPYFQAGGWLANTPVGKYVGGQLGEAMEAAQVPGQIVHGATRGMYGLATGESPRQAFDAALEVGQNDLAENGQLVTDWANQRGWHPTDAKAAGLATEFLADPLTYAGMGLLGKVVR